MGCYPSSKWSVDPFQIHHLELSTLQCSGEPYTGELTNGARTSVEVWGS